MNIKDLSYRKRNKFLYAFVGVLALLCWVFSFSKTWEAYKKNKLLTSNITKDAYSFQNFHTQEKKFIQLDSLVRLYSVDSVLFETNFLTNISQSINGLPVELVYDVSKVGNSSIDNVLSNTFSLQGDYKSILKSMRKIENDFFVSRVVYNNDYYHLEVRAFVDSQ